MAAQQNVAFALNPAAAVAGLIDWQSSIGSSIQKYATKPLISEGSFLGQSNELLTFLLLFEMRGRQGQYGWFDSNGDPSMGLIRETPGNPDSEVYNIVENYGSLSLQEVRAHEEAYLFLPVRGAQDNQLALICLKNSIDIELMKKCLLRQAEWKVEDPLNPGFYEYSAMLLLMIIIEECSIQTNATGSSIRTQLANLDKYVPKVDSDVLKLNQHVQKLLAELSAWGETTSDLLVNLWKAYKVVGDKKFVEWITRRRYEEYELSDENMEPQVLMNLAANKFNLMKEANEWMQPSEADKTVLALHAGCGLRQRR